MPSSLQLKVFLTQLKIWHSESQRGSPTAGGFLAILQVPCEVYVLFMKLCPGRIFLILLSYCAYVYYSGISTGVPTPNVDLDEVVALLPLMGPVESGPSILPTLSRQQQLGGVENCQRQRREIGSFHRNLGGMSCSPEPVASLSHTFLPQNFSSHKDLRCCRCGCCGVLLHRLFFHCSCTITSVQQPFCIATRMAFVSHFADIHSHIWETPRPPNCEIHF